MELGMDRWDLPVARLDGQGPPSDDGAQTASAPGPLPASRTEPAGQLGYARAPAWGEIRYVREGDYLRVLVGGVTPGQYLRQQWPALLRLAMMAGPTLAMFILAYLFKVVAYQQTWPLGLLLGLVLLTDVWRFYRGLRGANGTATLVVSPVGLAFENAPGSPRSGQVTRDQVGSLLVALHALRFLRTRLYALKMTLRDTGQVITLAKSTDVAALNQLRNEAAWAMGIERPVCPLLPTDV
jgi:hypothetical protein